MTLEPQHYEYAADLAADQGANLLPPVAVGYLDAVGRLEGTFEGSLRGRGVELLSDGRIRSMPALGLTPEEARAHAYELLAVADIKEARA